MLGGQHIAKAVKELWQGELTRGKREADIADAWKTVSAEVLDFTIPHQLAKLAAGKHQEHQTELMTVTTADMCSLLAQETSARGKLLEGEELFRVIQTAGLASEPQKAAADEKSPKVKKQSSVCLPPKAQHSHPSVHRGTTTTSGTGPWPSWSGWR